MESTFLQTTFGTTGRTVHRLGLSTTYRPGKKTIHAAIDAGINFFFGFGIDTQMMKVMRDVLRQDRSRYLVATGPYNLVYGHTDIRRSLEKRLRQLRTDYIDVFLFLGVLKEKEFPQKVRDEMLALREEGKVRGFGLSTHDRLLAGELARQGAVDTLMIRYNAAHRGAEKDIFPYLETHNPGLISYTATKWRELLRRPKGWPADRAVPDAGLCYRFVLSNPAVDVCLIAPSNLKHLKENLLALEKGPLDEDEMDFMHRFGDAVYNRKKWFM